MGVNTISCGRVNAYCARYSGAGRSVTLRFYKFFVHKKEVWSDGPSGTECRKVRHLRTG